MTSYLPFPLLDHVILMYVDFATLGNALILTQDYKDVIYRYAKFNRIDVSLYEFPELMDKVPDLKDVFSRLISERYSEKLQGDFGKRMIETFKHQVSGDLDFSMLISIANMVFGFNQTWMKLFKMIEQIGTELSTNFIKFNMISKEIIDFDWSVRTSINDSLVDYISVYDSGIFKEMLGHMKKLPELRETLNKISNLTINSYIPKDCGRKITDLGREFVNRPSNAIFKQGFDTLFPANAAPNPKGINYRQNFLSAINLIDNISSRSIKVTIVSENTVDILLNLSIKADDWVNHLDI